MKQKDEYVTKEYLKESLLDLKSELGSEMGEMREELVQIKDEIVGEIKALREEFETHAFTHERINNDSNDHESRITYLESAKNPQ